MKQPIILIFATAVAVGLIAWASVSTMSVTTTAVMHISAKNFAFTPDRIMVRKGQAVVIELRSEDRVHGFRLPAFGVRTEIKPGTVSTLDFTPDKTGTFTFHCDVFCGEGHEDMIGTLVVTE